MIPQQWLVCSGDKQQRDRYTMTVDKQRRLTITSNKCRRDKRRRHWNSCLKEKRKGGRSFTVKASKKNQGLVKSDCQVSYCSSESSMLAFCDVICCCKPNIRIQSLNEIVMPFVSQHDWWCKNRTNLLILRNRRCLRKKQRHLYTDGVSFMCEKSIAMLKLLSPSRHLIITIFCSRSITHDEEN